ncbi:MAG: BolA/IbaG family iron-sulfur metabolism protein [Pseudohongiellaceae bacterium]
MSIQTEIELKLQERFNPQHLVVENESHRHSGPATDSHFKLTVVAAGFDGQGLVKRHQQVYQLLGDELAGGVHALALHLYSPQEWTAKNETAPLSPDCRGGSKSG